MKRRDLLKGGIAAGICALAGKVSLGHAASIPAHRPEESRKHFLKSMNCSQAILETYAPLYDLKPEVCRRLATGFAGGMGTGHECGAVTAAYMVLGLAFGPKEGKVFPKIEEFNKQFRARHREITCSQLLGIDMSNAKGVKEAAKRGLFKTVCPGFVKSAGEILDQLIA